MEFKSVNNLEFNSAVLPTNGLCRGVGGANILWRLINLLGPMQCEGGGGDLRVYPLMTAGRRDSLKEAEVRVGMIWV